MKQAFKDVLVELFGSKKFLVFVASVAVIGIAKLLAILHVTATVTVDDLMPYLVLLSSYLVGQGIADHGKEAAKVQATAAVVSSVPGNDSAAVGNAVERLQSALRKTAA